VSILRRIYAWVTGRRVIYLMDHDGEVSERIAYLDPFGMWAYRMRLIGASVRLLPDGKTLGPCYVRKWVYADGTNDPSRTP